MNFLKGYHTTCSNQPPPRKTTHWADKKPYIKPQFQDFCSPARHIGENEQRASSELLVLTSHTPPIVTNVEWMTRRGFI